MKETSCIDFVIPWVDDSDPVWQKKKEQYTGVAVQEGNTAARYRDWGTLKYWFRGVEAFAPWVRYVHFVSDEHVPAWLNVSHPKLRIVKHTDYIPQEYLPTFSCQAIEWNLHRIEGLAEQFVYFNDDVFLIDSTKPEDFFVDGLPCDCPDIGPLYANGFFSHILLNNIELINRHFSLRRSIRHNPMKWIKAQSPGDWLKLLIYGRKDMIPNSTSRHIHTSFLKKTFDALWEKEGEQIHATCKNRLRTKDDITSYCVRDWQLFSGEFYPKKSIGRLFHTAEMETSDEILNYLQKQKGKVICLNDSEDEENFEEHKRRLIEVFERLLPEKSAYER